LLSENNVVEGKDHVYSDSRGGQHCGSAPVSSKAPRSRWLTPALGGGVGRRIGRRKAKLMDWDNGSLT